MQFLATKVNVEIQISKLSKALKGKAVIETNKL